MLPAMNQSGKNCISLNIFQRDTRNCLHIFMRPEIEIHLLRLLMVSQMMHLFHIFVMHVHITTSNFLDLPFTLSFCVCAC